MEALEFAEMFSKLDINELIYLLVKLSQMIEPEEEKEQNLSRGTQ